MQTTHDETDFYEVFARDLRKARGLVLIQSPFLSDFRIDKLEKLFRGCINRRVRICIFIQSPRKPDPELDRKQARLEAMGIHVCRREGMHEKVAVVDEFVLAHGSLNICSQTDSTERMTRTTDRKEILDAIVRHKLNSCDRCFEVQPLICKLPDFATPEDFLAAIGKIIEQRREFMHLSQRELGSRSGGIAQSTISKIESGKCLPKIDTLCRICSQLQLVLDAHPWYASAAINEICRALAQNPQ